MSPQALTRSNTVAVFVTVNVAGESHTVTIRPYRSVWTRATGTDSRKTADRNRARASIITYQIKPGLEHQGCRPGYLDWDRDMRFYVQEPSEAPAQPALVPDSPDAPWSPSRLGTDEGRDGCTCLNPRSPRCPEHP
jgi:hypothetical protein